MATRYWVGGSGNWTAIDTTHWSLTSGGGGGASVPTDTEDVVFNSSSNATAYAVSVLSPVSCKTLTCGNPASGVLTVQGSGNLFIYGDMTLAAGVLFNLSGILYVGYTVIGGSNLTTNGVHLNMGAGSFRIGYPLTLMDDLSITATAFAQFNSSATAGLIPNGKTVTIRMPAAGATYIYSNDSSLPFNFYNLVILGYADNIGVVRIEPANHYSIAGNLTITGNSSSNRLTVYTLSQPYDVAHRNNINVGGTIAISNCKLANMEFITSASLPVIMGTDCIDIYGNRNMIFAQQAGSRIKT